ncbi:uncharacterized protein RNJ42_02296 [Nakaseomyces bracarensis]|uniref:uncharacterized protein n=1 Tax=Nakaseomyces bracarensis TaxID=273131 RepID=UPI0038723813
MKDLDYSFSMEDLSTLEGEFGVEHNTELVDFDEFLNIGESIQLMTPPTMELHRAFTTDSLPQFKDASPSNRGVMDRTGNYHIYGSTPLTAVDSPALQTPTDAMLQNSEDHDNNNNDTCNNLIGNERQLSNVDLSTVLKLRSRNLQLRRSKSTQAVYQRPRHRSQSTSNLQTPPSSSSSVTPNNSTGKVKRNPFYCPSGKVLKIIEKEKKKQGDTPK